MGIPKSLKIVLKIIIWTIVSLITLIILSLATIIWVLTPSQLTPLCEKYANEYLDAKVSAEEVELTIWKTFPYATISVKDLTIISNSLKTLTPQERVTLPANADTLLCSQRIQASMNLLKVSLGIFELKDIMIDAPRINAVIFNNSIANYNIVPPSSDNEPTIIPEISINSFEITNGKGISYYNAMSNISANIDVTAAQITEMSDKNYQFIFSGNTSATVGSDISIPSFPLTINGIIDWSYKNPLVFTLNKWDLSVNNTPIKIDFAMDMQKNLMINKLNIKMDSVSLASISPFIPKAYSKYTENINTNINSSIKLSLLRPYEVGSISMPYVDFDIKIPQSYLKDKKGRGVNKLIVDMNVNVNGGNLDSTVVTLNKFYMKGKALDFNIDGTVKNMLSNAHIKGRFKGKANIAKILSIIKLPLDFTISGLLDADATIDARVKQMNAKSFHLMKIDGNVNLNDFIFFNKKDPMRLYSHKMNFKFGTGTNISTNGVKISEITHATLHTDTLSYLSNGLNFTLKNGEISGGFKGNLSMKRDTTRLVPIGANLKAERINIVDIDSTVIKLRKIECNASIKRMADNPTKPHLDLNIKARRLSYADSTTRMNVRNAEIQMSAMPRIRKTNTRLNAIADSLSLIYSELSRDSVLSLARKERRSKMTKSKITAENSMSLKADTGIQRILNKWNISGIFKAERGGLFTPYFPLRNIVSKIDINFSTDSLIINNIDYRTGQSKFSMNGGIRNIRSTLLGRNRKPFSILFNLKSDTLDANELIKAAFAGSYYIDNVENRYTLGAGDSDEQLAQLATNATNNGDSLLSAIIIPQNIDAEINISARNGVYADMILKRARGSLLIHDGQLQLSNIMANTNKGAMALNALYSAPDKKNIKFAFDVSMKNIDISQFITLIPAVDSILPLLKSMDGIIRADIAATTDVDSLMNITIPSLKAAIRLHGDSLVLFDSETFSTVSKMLRFKNKQRNLIDNMDVEIIIQNSQLELFPFTFNMDRYKLGVMGHNDLDLNLDYHISVLKSPIPFKFGLNITGNVDNLKYRIGGARFKEDYVAQQSNIVNTTRINLREQINVLFRRGAKAGLNSTLQLRGRHSKSSTQDEILSHSDSIRLIKEGIIEAPVVKKLTPKQLKEQKKAEEKARKKAEKEKKEDEKKQKKLKKEETALIDPRQRLKK